MDIEDRTKDEASKSFVSYVEVVKKTISKVSSIEKRHLLDVFKELEESIEFKKLGEIFSHAYGGRRPDSANSRLQNYFRRSGFYLDITKGKLVDIDAEFEGLWAAFNERHVKKTTIIPINFVQFPEKVIDFGAFKIQALSKDELDNLLEQEVCGVFYPYAMINTKELGLFWHIVEERIEHRNKEDLSVIELGFSWKDTFKVKRKFPGRTLQLLALFDWGDASSRCAPDKQDTDYWFIPLNLPFEHTTSNNLIDWPKASPDLSRLATRPYYTPDGEETDKECPDFRILLSDSQVNELKKVIGAAHGFLKDIDLKDCKWEFLEIAMGSLAKAFLSDDIEQLLWNVVALEALIGDKKETTQTILRRTSLIYGGGDKRKIDEICKEIKKIYEFRSSLVHGSVKLDKDRKKDFFCRYHLRLARDYARKTVLWFIDYLSHMHRELQRGSVPLNKYPKRKDLLLILDYQIKNFEHEGAMVKMPDDFPRTAVG